MCIEVMNIDREVLIPKGVFKNKPCVGEYILINSGVYITKMISHYVDNEGEQRILVIVEKGA
jgi:hydrogenase maturation factor